MQAVARKVGKKPWIPNQAIYDKIYNLAKIGLSQKEIAGNLGIHEDTWYRKKEIYPELDRSYVNGKTEGIGFVAFKLMENVKKGDTRAIEFFLKCKAGWRDKDAATVIKTGTENKLIINDREKAKELIQKLIGGEHEPKDLSAGELHRAEEKS